MFSLFADLTVSYCSRRTVRALATALRRIKVDKLRNDANGQLAYKKLVKYAILYSPCYEGEMSELGEMRWTDILKKWDVELKYRDDENDMVTLSSGSEFTEAVQKSDKSLKFIATVKDLEVTKKEKGARNEIGGDGDEGEVTHNLEQKLRDIANHVCALDKHGSLQSFLEMLLTMLTTAFVAFQGQMAGGIFENHKKYVSSRSSYPCCSYKKKCDKAVSCGDWKGDPEAKKVAERILKQACAQKGEAVDKPDQSNIKSSRETNAAEENAEKGNEEESTKAETKIPEHPFVHFRHTCDKCSVSPIVGTRYHATNLPDYDLCAECMSKNTTEDIKFEPEELGTFVLRLQLCLLFN